MSAETLQNESQSARRYDGLSFSINPRESIKNRLKSPDKVILVPSLKGLIAETVMGTLV